MGEVKEIKLDVSAVRKSIANAQKLGNLPIVGGSFNKEVMPPFVEVIPQGSPTRTHEQAMTAFHNIQKESQQRQPEKAKIQNPPTRTHEQAMAALHNIESQYKQPIPQKSSQIEQPPPPVIIEKKDIFKKFSAWVFSKS